MTANTITPHFTDDQLTPLPPSQWIVRRSSNGSMSVGAWTVDDGKGPVYFHIKIPAEQIELV